MHTAEYYRNEMQTRIRWAADAATNAHIAGGDPILDALRLGELSRWLSDAESSVQAAREYLSLYVDAADAEEVE